MNSMGGGVLFPHTQTRPRAASGSQLEREAVDRDGQRLAMHFC